MGEENIKPPDNYFEHYHGIDSFLKVPDHNQMHPIEKVIIKTFETTVSLLLIYILCQAIANST